MAIDVERIRRMSAAGMSNREIGRELGCSYEHVRRVLAREGRIPVQPVSIRPTQAGIEVVTEDRAIVATTIKRALQRAGLLAGTEPHP